MGKVKSRPATTDDAREKQLINLAVNLAEEQLRNGTASSQVITHFLKLGSSKERIGKEILERQKDLITAKTDAIKSTKRTDEMFEKAIKAMRSYQGGRSEDDDDD